MDWGRFNQVLIFLNLMFMYLFFLELSLIVFNISQNIGLVFFQQMVQLFSIVMEILELIVIIFNLIYDSIRSFLYLDLTIHTIVVYIALLIFVVIMMKFLTIGLNHISLLQPLISHLRNFSKLRPLLYTSSLITNNYNNNQFK
jgi:hypothetical protein